MSDNVHALAQRGRLQSDCGWLLLLGFALMYVPTVFSMAHELWMNDDQTQGPVVLAVIGYLFWEARATFKQVGRGESAQPLAIAGFVLGLLMYMLGRSQGIFMLEVGSVLPILSALLYLHGGASLLRKHWFALVFLLFLIPLPGTVVQYLTMPMKAGISYCTEHVLYWLGYPIARSGVTLHIAQYRLLVADACAGLHTVFTLEAMGLMYLKLIDHMSGVRNTVLAVLIVPIGFIANVIRVMALVLITYYFGDEAGQGFLHGFAGMVLFMSALLLIVSVDSLLQRVGSARKCRMPVLAEPAS